ncbi:hypothetical protein CgunFtcFv8_027660 [Champsocephalus gunnari]|uniref:Uncharacterized protein n=1 Tax=Champsocephalus gunnari TaxID=52237 RepID=A0AAN8ED46_CHAGU|nr:hypothetical protein CgunFtcFv8_027660 [Champsocephalus gunnari]
MDSQTLHSHLRLRDILVRRESELRYMYSKERQHLDGLNNLHDSPHFSLSSLYKNITVDLDPELAPISDY